MVTPVTGCERDQVQNGSSAGAVGHPGTAPIRLTLPEPTGPYRIGSSSLHLIDQDRTDPWRSDRKRELMVTLTYPAPYADSGGSTAWLSPGIAAVVEDHAAADPLNIPKRSAVWDTTKRWARADARLRRDLGRWPVVLFSPGFGVPREAYTVLTDDLASHGYVVVAMSHTYETIGVEFPGRRIETAVQDRRDQRRETMKTAIDARVADTRFVLDQLTLLNAGLKPDAEKRPLPHGLRDAFDESRIGMFGHSYGGYTTGEAMYQDRRIGAGANLDGNMAYSFGGTSGLPYLPGEVAKHGLEQPFLLMGANNITNPATSKTVEHNHLPESGDQSWVDFWRNQRGWKRDLTLWQGAHMSYSDLQAIVPQFGSLIPASKRAPLIGTVDPARSLIAQHDYLAAFFDLHLRGRDSHLLDGPSPRYPEITFAG